MQIVIDIPEEVYDHVLKAKSIPDMLGIDILNVINAVKNGILLPKEHGRLIDENDLKTLFRLDDRLWWSNAVDEFADLPTIIAAHKEDTNEIGN